MAHAKIEMSDDVQSFKILKFQCVPCTQGY